MAGDWIKFEHVTPDKPEVVSMAAKLGIDQDAVVGKLIRVWIWADQQSRDGHALSVTKAFLDRVTFQPGFADSMESAGWLTNDGNLSLPNFDRHNGETAKKRALSNRRKALSRNGHADVPKKSRDERDQNGDQRREEKSIPPISPPEGDDLVPVGAKEVESVYQAYPRKVGKPTALRSIRKACRKFGSPYVLERTRLFASTCDKPEDLIPHPSTFFNQERFNDDPETWKDHADHSRNNPQSFDRGQGTCNADVVNDYAGR